MLEVPGLGYGRAVWIPHQSWTVSVIANTDKGRDNLIRDFKTTYAVKLDYTAEKKYFSLIPSYREDGKTSLGFFGGWTVSDALLLHIEGSVPDRTADTAILVGGAYTLERGPTIGGEFFHDGSGCTLRSTALCVARGFGTGQPSDILIRQNYILLQYGHARIRDTTLNLILRWIRDLNDDSDSMISILEYGLSDRTQLFVIGGVNHGNKDAEFGSLITYSLMAGVRFTL